MFNTSGRKRVEALIPLAFDRRYSVEVARKRFDFLACEGASRLSTMLSP